MKIRPTSERCRIAIGNRTSVGNRTTNQIINARTWQSHFIAGANIDSNRSSKHICYVADADSKRNLAQLEVSEQLTSDYKLIIPDRGDR